MRRLTFSFSSLLLLFSSVQLFAQRNRISVSVQENRRVALAGHVHPKVVAADDQGPVSPSLLLPSVSLLLKPSTTQEADLEQLLADQQDPSSPNYRHWLTPEQYADRFGASPADIQQLVDWLKQHNFNVTAVARARNSIAFSGTAAQVESTFGTVIHDYLVNGTLHFANSANPSVPAALSGIVLGIRGLHDFRTEPRKIRFRPLSNASSNSHFLAPDDLSTIYKIKPLYDAGLDGTGQKLVVVGRTQIDLSDIDQFRLRFGLPVNDPDVILVPNLPDPGVGSQDELMEADLDIEWSGAVARGAKIIYVYSSDVSEAVHYAIDQKLAPVVSMSFGMCEFEALPLDLQAWQVWPGRRTRRA